MRVQILASGSKGNLIYVAAGRARLLVDLGLSCREAERRLTAAGIDPGGLTAILVTHSHTDHLRGVRVFSRKHQTPVYLTHGTHQEVRALAADWFAVKLFKPGRALNFGDLQVQPFAIPHETEDPVAFTFTSAAGKFGLATDLGHATAGVRQALAACRLLMVEANHDEQMLWDGPYPGYLKRRVASNYGHLSNAQCAQLVRQLAHPGLQGVILGHLSEQNNTPAKALAAIRPALAQSRLLKIPLKAASQYEPLPPIVLK